MSNVNSTSACKKVEEARKALEIAYEALNEHRNDAADMPFDEETIEEQTRNLEEDIFEAERLLAYAECNHCAHNR